VFAWVLGCFLTKDFFFRAVAKLEQFHEFTLQISRPLLLNIHNQDYTPNNTESPYTKSTTLNESSYDSSNVIDTVQHVDGTNTLVPKTLK